MKPLSPNELRKDFTFGLAVRWLFLGSIVGCVAGLAAIIFQVTIQSLTGFLSVAVAGMSGEYAGGEPQPFDYGIGTFTPWLVVLLPAMGGLVAGILIYGLAPEAAGAGTDASIDAFHRKRGRIRGRVPIVKILASSVTLGTGGSGGREGPIAQIGAGVGSFLSEKLHLTTRTRRWLLAAGISAGIGSIFRAPLAGALFACEVLYSDADVESDVLLPAIVASIISYSVYSTYSDAPHIFDPVIQQGISGPMELVFYLGLAVILILAAYIYIGSFRASQVGFQKVPLPLMFRPALGGLMVGVIGLALFHATGDSPEALDVMGSGYGLVQATVSGKSLSIGVGFLLLIAAGKVVTTCCTIGSGGSAGLFGPSIVIGAALGRAVGEIFHQIAPDVVTEPSTFAIVGMAGFFAAAAKTPISSVVMVSELTGNYELLVPSMWVCAITFMASRRWGIFTKQVPTRLQSPAHFGEYAMEIFGSTKVSEVFKTTRKFVTIDKDLTVHDIFDATHHTRQRLFPVVDDAGHVIGSFRIDDLTHAVHEEGADNESMTAFQLARKKVFGIHPSDNTDRAQRLLTHHHVEELLVLDDENPRKVVGILTAADIMLAYNRKLAQITRGKTPSGQDGFVRPTDTQIMRRIEEIEQDLKEEEESPEGP